MAHRIEVSSKIPDTRAAVLQEELRRNGFKVDVLGIVDAYTIDKELSPEQLAAAAASLANPVTELASIDGTVIPPGLADAQDWVIEIGFKPGVTDNVAGTARETIEDLLKTAFRDGEVVYTSQLMHIRGDIPTKADAERMGASLANTLIQRVQATIAEEFPGERDIFVPKVKLSAQVKTDTIHIGDMSDDDLRRIGKWGVFDHNRELTRDDYLRLQSENAKDQLKLGDLFENEGRYFENVRRGTLALDLKCMHTIRDHFRPKGRDPTDVELESIAQSWSEHCKHTIFAAKIDGVAEGLYQRFIKGATSEIMKRKGDRDFCVSVFVDNSGAIVFDEQWLVTHKVETHNSPSALDPFGGAITGIVGVNRDTIGFGKGAKPIINTYGFCFGRPEDQRIWYRGKNNTNPVLSPRRIMDGVIKGVRVGGNCSGIPTPQGFAYFDDSYCGKPLVFVGTVGLIPRNIDMAPSHEKLAMPGDYIVMVGGRVGIDGIHGATFSSEALDSGSPPTAVQIGDPITQKKLSDAIVKEARALGLYTSITDNGAGGLSCSVAEMAKESKGCKVDLDKVPTKYPGLPPWQIWISESQERMTLAVPPGKLDQFVSLMRRRGVEATVIGEFTDDSKCVVKYGQETVMDVDLKFLHDGLPEKVLTTTFTRPQHDEPQAGVEDLTTALYEMLGRHNICSKEFISTQYDHEVQAGSVLKPLVGKGRVNSDATVTRPLLDSFRGVALSQAAFPAYSKIDTHAMAACGIDAAVRNIIAVGGRLEQVALLDNFCWCSSDETERLGQLKRAAEACFDTAVAYETPFISGKDSMFNDFKGYDEQGNPVKISALPTLLVSSIAVVPDVRKCVSMDFKAAGDVIYVLGETKDELGASEYFAMLGEKQRDNRLVGNSVPSVEPKKNIARYTALAKAMDDGLVASAHAPGIGGLAASLAKCAIAGRLGAELDISVLAQGLQADRALFSESTGRFVVSVAPGNVDVFEQMMQGTGQVYQIGRVAEHAFTVRNQMDRIVETQVAALEQSYKERFAKF